MRAVTYVTCADVEIDDDHVRVILDYGHSYEARPQSTEISVYDYFTSIAQMIGHHQRCLDCEAAQAEIERQVP